MFLAWKEIQHSKGRYLMIGSIIVLIAYLVFFLTYLAIGLSQSNRSAVDHWEASGVVLSDDANNNLMASTIPLTVNEELDVSLKAPINVRQMVVNKVNAKQQFNLVFMGTDSNWVIPKIINGRKANNKNEIVVSKTVKDKYKIALGDIVENKKSDTSLKVVGFTDASEYSVQPVAYLSLDSMNDSGMMKNISSPDSVNGIVVRNDKKLSNLPKGTKYVEISNFINKLPGYQAQIITFGLMIGSLVIISAIILGVFLYILTMQKIQIFGLLKAQGIANRYIVKSVISQTFIVTFVSVALGLLLSVITVYLLPAQVPVEFNGLYSLILSGVLIVCALLGSVTSVKQVSKISPLIALK